MSLPCYKMIPHFTKTYRCVLKQGKAIQLLHVFCRALNGEWMSLPCYKMIPHFTKTYRCVLKQGKAIQFQCKQGVICSYYFRELLMEKNCFPLLQTNGMFIADITIHFT